MGITSTKVTEVGMDALEEYARDRGIQLETAIAELKSIKVHLSLITDEEIEEYDTWGS